MDGNCVQYANLANTYIHSDSSPQSARQAGPFLPDETIGTSQRHMQSPPPPRLTSRNAQPGASHSRDVSAARGRTTDSPGFGPPPISSQPQFRTQAHSKSPETTGGRSASGPGGGELERRPSDSYGHHRQTSIVHGNIQHSRDASYSTSSATTSPLSPDVFAPAGHGPGLGSDANLNGRRDYGDAPSHYAPSGNNPLSQLQSSALAPIQDSDFGDHSTEQQQQQHAQRKIAHGGKSRRGHSRHVSHSKHGGSEAKTVGEYALHHLFNSVCDKLSNDEMAYSNTINSLLAWRKRK